MALIFCYECSKEISDKAPACPHCGAPAEIRSDHVEEPQVTQHQAIETEQREEPVPEPVPETPKKDEPFNQIVALAVGALVFQIVRALGMSLGALSVVFMIAPIVLLVRYVKKQTTQVYAGIIVGLVVVLSLAISSGPGDVFIPPTTTTPASAPIPEPATTSELAPTPDLSPERPAPSRSNVTVDTTYSEGRIFSIETLVNGIEHGPYQWFQHSNGALTVEGIFTNGVRGWEGVQISYHANGSRKYVATKEQGKNHGLFIHMADDGSIVQQGLEFLGERCGEWTGWAVEGINPQTGRRWKDEYVPICPPFD